MPLSVDHDSNPFFLSSLFNGIYNPIYFITAFQLATQRPCFARSHAKETLLEIIFFKEWPYVMVKRCTE